jgi:hypothetical protein
VLAVGVGDAGEVQSDTGLIYAVWEPTTIAGWDLFRRFDLFADRSFVLSVPFSVSGRLALAVRTVRHDGASDQPLARPARVFSIWLCSERWSDFNGCEVASLCGMYQRLVHFLQGIDLLL